MVVIWHLYKIICVCVCVCVSERERERERGREREREREREFWMPQERSMRQRDEEGVGDT